MIVAVLLTDGRCDLLRETVATLPRLHPVDRWLLIDDTGDSTVAQHLDWTFPQFDEIVHHSQRRGLAGAVRSAWTTALEYNPDYILHCEDDLPITVDIDLSQLVAILDNHPTLAQVSLKRNPVNDVEVAAGGFVQTNPGAYWQREDYVEHQLLFTFNPSLIPSDVVELLLREDHDGLERGVTDTLLDFDFSFGIFGTIEDAPRITHTGHARSSGWKV